MQKMNIKYLFIFLISWLSLTLFFSVLAIDLMDYSTFFFVCAIAFLLSFVTLWAVWQSDKNAKNAIKKATEDTKKQEETEKERQKEEERKKREEEERQKKEQELTSINERREAFKEKLRLQEEERKKQQEEEIARLEAEYRKRQELAEEEERKKREEEERARLVAEYRKRQELAEEEERKKREEEERQKKEQELISIKERRKAFKEKLRLQEEERKKQQEEEIARLEAEYRKRQELAEKEKHEWAMKMAEIRKQKKIEKEEQLKKLEDNIISSINDLKKQLSHNLEKIGAMVQLTHHNISKETLEFLANKNLTYLDIIYEHQGYLFSILVSVKECVDIKSLFSVLKDLDWECSINDMEGHPLIDICYSNDYECCIEFKQDNLEEKFIRKGNIWKQAENLLFCYLENRKIKRLENCLDTIIQDGISQAPSILANGVSLEEKVCSALESSNYDIDFRKGIECSREKDMLVVDYELPSKPNLSEVKEYKYISSSKEISTKRYAESYIAKRYENVLYSITLRSLYEIFSIDSENAINSVTFNGFVTQVNLATGITERKCILSIQVDKEKFSQINLSQVEPKACFKALKGVSAAKLIDVSPVTPILTFNKKDKRFVEGKDIEVNQGTNLAAMHWEDFEHLVRELFEMEFARNGGEVRVTQASRDGGVDAIVFDPDPLRGGKIVIQAKRYTNTVGVSAVRDLYGTVINEGANSGILITTSDYGHDSYEFAKDKPLKLLNGGHLLALLQKNGRKAHIDIDEAKKIISEK